MSSNTRSKRKRTSTSSPKSGQPNFMDCFNQLNEKMSSLIMQNKNLEKLLKKSNLRTQKLESKVNHLEHQVTKLQQDKLKNNLVLIGLPKVTGEDLLAITFNIATHYKIAVNRANIKTVFRIKRRDSKKNKSTLPEPVVLVLNDFESKLLFLKAFKEQGLISHQLNIEKEKEASKIFCRNHLTRENRTLLYKAQDLKEVGYKNIWIKNSIVFAQKVDETPAQITNSHQIEVILSQAKGKSSADDSSEDSSSSSDK